MNIPIITGGKALELAALSCSSNGYASMYSSAMSPFSKTTVDINKLYVSGSYSNKISDEGEGSIEKAEEALLSKTGECLLGGGAKGGQEEPKSVCFCPLTVQDPDSSSGGEALSFLTRQA